MGETPAHRELPAVRRFPLLILSLAALFVALYIVTVVLYAGSGGTDAGTPVDDSAEGMHVVLTPRDVDAASDRLTFDIEFAPGSTLVSDDGLRVASTFDLLLSSSGDVSGRVIHYERGMPAASALIELRSEGEIELWPFDTHPSRTMLLVTTPAEDGGDAGAVPADLSLGAHHVPGWTITLDPDPAVVGTAADGVVVHQYVIEAERAPATVVFGIVLLVLMIAMPVLGLTAAILALRGRRRIEVSFFTWSAGMLFATPTLRNFLPGQPPIGSWVDYLVVLWAIAGLVLALLISVVAWYRWGRPQPELEAAEARAGSS